MTWKIPRAAHPRLMVFYRGNEERAAQDQRCSCLANTQIHQLSVRPFSWSEHDSASMQLYNCYFLVYWRFELVDQHNMCHFQRSIVLKWFTQHRRKLQHPTLSNSLNLQLRKNWKMWNARAIFSWSWRRGTYLTVANLHYNRMINTWATNVVKAEQANQVNIDLPNQ